MNLKTKDLTVIGLYAALIVLGIMFFRIPLGSQFVHMGNALIAVGILVFGAKKGAIAASIGLAIFDITHGYASVAWVTVLESLIVALVLYLVFEKAMKKHDTTINIIICAIVAAITKIIVNLIKYTFFRNMLVGGLAFKPAFLAALVKIGGTFGSAAVTIIAVPLLYPIFKKIGQRYYQN